MSAQHFRKVPRPDMPSGPQLVVELEDHARTHGVHVRSLVKPLCGVSQNPTNWLEQMKRTKCPRQNTVDRVRALIAGDEIPPPSKTYDGHKGGPRCARVVKLRVPDAATLEAGIRAERRRQAGRLTTRHPLAIDGLPTPEERSAKASDLIRWANEEWPEIAFEVVAYAKEEGRSVADAWRSVITAGLQCLREA